MFLDMVSVSFYLDNENLSIKGCWESSHRRAVKDFQTWTMIQDWFYGTNILPLPWRARGASGQMSGKPYRAFTPYGAVQLSEVIQNISLRLQILSRFSKSQS